MADDSVEKKLKKMTGYLINSPEIKFIEQTLSVFF